MNSSTLENKLINIFGNASVGTVVITPPARRAWRSYKFAPFVFFPVSKVGAPLMGDTAVHSLSHDFKLNF